MNHIVIIRILIVLVCCLTNAPLSAKSDNHERMRVIATTDGEIDDECSLVRFLLYANEWDVEGIITSSSQYHCHGHNWAGDNWTAPYLDAYEKVYPQLLKHDNRYPSPAFLRERTVLGNVNSEGDMDAPTAGSDLIVKILLDENDSRPVWLQAWGGTNTIARALKTIEEEHPEKMEQVAAKLRFFFIWEQDNTYQEYIRPHWGKYNIMTIISDQFITWFYHWKKYIPIEQQHYLMGDWMKANILEHHGALCSLYKAHDNGDFRSEGDSPAFFHIIPTGLGNQEHPDWGGWGGRYIRVRENTWLDPVPEVGYQYPEGRWYTSNAWGRTRLKMEIANDQMLLDYLNPSWRWINALQNDFATRADWCVKSYAECNHAPIVKLKNRQHVIAKSGQKIALSAKGTKDPDSDQLLYHWWVYQDAGNYHGTMTIADSGKMETTLIVPADAKRGDTIHVICEVTDSGSPQLTRYQRVVIEVK